MESWISLVVVVYLFVAFVGQLCVGTADGGTDGMHKMTFKSPNISEEEAHSNFMPDQLKCDACRIVVYQVSLEKLSNLLYTSCRFLIACSDYDRKCSLHTQLIYGKNCFCLTSKFSVFTC